MINARSIPPKTYATWTTAMLLAWAAYQADLQLKLDQSNLNRGVNAHVFHPGSNATVERTLALAVSDDHDFESLAMSFTDKLRAAQEPLGHEFAKVLQANFMDLLA